MAIYFEKLVSLGVLMVGELDSTLICHLGFSHQEITNHQGLDVKNLGNFSDSCTSCCVLPRFSCPGKVVFI